MSRKTPPLKPCSTFLSLLLQYAANGLLHPRISIRKSFTAKAEALVRQTIRVLEDHPNLSHPFETRDLWPRNQKKKGGRLKRPPFN